MKCEDILNAIREGNTQGLVLIEEKFPENFYGGGTQRTIRFIRGVVPTIRPTNEKDISLELSWPDDYNGIPDCWVDVSWVTKIVRPTEEQLRKVLGDLVDKIPKGCSYEAASDFDAEWFARLKERDLERKLFAAFLD